MGSKYAIHLILIALIVVGALIPAALYVRSLLEVNLKGVVDVKPNIKVVDVEFSIDDGVGEKLIDLGNIHIPAGNVIIRSKLVSYEGNFTLILSGELMLESNTSSYRVLMPCLANIGDNCYRIMMLIPGYDAPLPVSEGDYNAALTIRWSAEGVGRFHLKLVLEFSETTGNVSISVIGIKPGSIDGWVVAHNSTRSYSMLVNPVSDTSALVWVWIFDPSNVSSNLLTFEVIEDSTGREIFEEVVEMFRDGVYWSVLVEVDVPIGRYVIKSSFGDVVMSATIGPH
ncbi:MAG: hypothetical protein QXZ63_07750 [Sulfolobales archaeon]